MAAKARKTSHQVPQFDVIVTRRFSILREWQAETLSEDETSNPRPSDLVTSALEFRTPSPWPPLFQPSGGSGSEHSIPSPTPFNGVTGGRA